MFTTIKKTIGTFRRDEDGATLVEYGIALSLAIAVGATAFATLSDDVGATVSASNAALPYSATTDGYTCE